MAGVGEGLFGKRVCGWGRRAGEGEMNAMTRKGNGWRDGGQEVPRRAEPITLTSVAHPAKLCGPLKASSEAGARHAMCADYMESHS